MNGYIVIVLVFVLAIVFVAIILFKKKITVINSEINEISNDRLEKIKDKYNSLEKIKKIKKITKEDVEAFYKSQMDEK